MEKASLVFASGRVEDRVCGLQIHQTRIEGPRALEVARRHHEAIVPELVDRARGLLESAEGASSGLLGGAVEKRIRLLEQCWSILFSQCLSVDEADLVAMWIFHCDDFAAAWRSGVLDGRSARMGCSLFQLLDAVDDPVTTYEVPF